MGIERNDGVMMTGGTMTAGQIAAGRNARARATFNGPVGRIENAGRDEVAIALKDLLDKLELHEHDIEDYAEIIDSTRMVADELAKPQPNKRTVTSLLAGIKEGVSAVAGLVTSVGSLAAAAGAIF